jgi:peptidoglycan/LPS O-acetylase OafA/YrhL
LITKIIYDDINAKTYGVAEFYHRRIRRIFPALFVMFATCIGISFFTGMGSGINEIGKSVASSIFFSSNILFYFSNGYFDTSLTSNPVLHTWSLSVEEQFYIIFPIFMFSIRSLSQGRQRWVLIIAAAMSFVASAVQVYVEPTGAFYMVYFRAWELLVGGLVAIGVFPVIRQQLALEAIALAGLAAIVVALRFYDKTTPFPGLAAVLPCVGASAIIYAGGCSGNMVSRLLGLPPVRFIGLISYSLYLWHWPLFVFYTRFYDLVGAAKKELLVVAIIVATASWWFVERPFRQKPYRLGQHATLGTALGVMVVTAGIAMSLGPIRASYWPEPGTLEKFVAYESYDADASMRVGTCFLTAGFNSFSWYKPDECLRLSKVERNVLIVGDSHAAHLWVGYQTAFPDVNFLQATASGCVPVESPSGEARCRDLMLYIFRKFLPANHVDTIILSGRWKSSDVAQAVATAGDLRKYATRVVISGPIQEYDGALPRLLAHAATAGEDFTQMVSRHLLPAPKATDRIFAAASLPDGVTYVSVYNALCTPNCRPILGDDVPVQFDYGHLTKEGAIYLARQVGPLALGMTRQ